MAIIKVDSVFFRNLSAYLEKLSDICLNRAQELHTKIDNSTDSIEIITWHTDAQGFIGEAKAYLNAKKELDELLEKLEREFTVEKDS